MSMRANRVAEQMKKELGDIIGQQSEKSSNWFRYCNRCRGNW